jgi:hypothetical protein
MNRHERRAARAIARATKLEPVTAIHEAGHAVGRYLTADEIGYPADEAISYIEIGTGGRCESIDGKTILLTEATTYGPMLSREIFEIIRREAIRGEISTDRNRIRGEDAKRAIAKAHSQGVDTLKWLRARLFYIMLGPAAEAKYRGIQLDEVLASYQAESDLIDAVNTCSLAGITEEADIYAYTDAAEARAKSTIQQPRIWQAIVTLANALPAAGQFSGRRAAKIIELALAD